MMLTKYEVAWTVELGYLASKTFVTRYCTYEQLEHFSRAHLSQGCLGSADFSEISEIRPTLRSCISELKKYFLWDRYRWKDLCIRLISFKTSLIRAKTGTCRQSYSRYKIQNFRKSAFTAPPIPAFCQCS